MPIERLLAPRLLEGARAFPAVVLTGPRRSGKTFLLRRLLPQNSYFLFEDPDVVGRFRADPQGFLDGVRTPATFDEIQNVPEVFNFVRARIDRKPNLRGQWFLTGSQESGLMRNVTESMAGRAAILQLWPLSARESPRVDLLNGGYPEVIARPRAAGLWFSSYVQTFLERDVRAITSVHDIVTFRRFLALVASRHGQVLSRSDLAAPLGISVPTVGRWLDILEATGQILVVPPYFENMGKRLIKSPKVYIADSGLACHLLGIESNRELEKSPFLGSLFEGLVGAEIVKQQLGAGRRREIYFFRDQQGLEVDFLVPRKNGSLLLVEAKATRTPTAGMARPMQQLVAARGERAGARPVGAAEGILVHRPARNRVDSTAMAPGIKAMVWRDFLEQAAD